MYEYHTHQDIYKHVKNKDFRTELIKSTFLSYGFLTSYYYYCYFCEKLLHCVQILSVSDITSYLHTVAMFVFVNLQTVRVHNMYIVCRYVCILGFEVLTAVVMNGTVTYLGVTIDGVDW
jgi:hypothetical protein